MKQSVTASIPLIFLIFQKSIQFAIYNNNIENEVVRIPSEVAFDNVNPIGEKELEEFNVQPHVSGLSAQNSSNGDDEFGEESEEDIEKERIIRDRLKDYYEKKANAFNSVAKSNIIYDVKPLDETINLTDIEARIREIKVDGLLWGSAITVPIAFGIMKLRICCVVEDDKVSTDWLEEQITDLNDLVQSIDIVAFNKV